MEGPRLSESIATHALHAKLARLLQKELPGATDDYYKPHEGGDLEKYMRAVDDFGDQFGRGVDEDGERLERFYPLPADRETKEWTGPTEPGDLDEDEETLARLVPPERWPYGPPSAHEDVCLLHSGGLYCDCLASEAEEP